jgi:hypothetical protein
MYAVIGRWTMDQRLREEQDRELHDVMVPMVTSHPSFIAGHWTRDSSRVCRSRPSPSRGSVCDCTESGMSGLCYRCETLTLMCS